MSKKSRRRNKRLLALAGLAGAVALSNRKAKADLASTEDNKGGIDTITKAKQAMTSDAAYSPSTTVTTKKTIQDNKPVKRRDTILGKPGINKMDTSEVDLDYTAPSTTKYRNMDMGLGPFAAKDGGRAKHKSGGKVRGCGIAKRGLGRAMKKGKR